MSPSQLFQARNTVMVALKVNIAIVIIVNASMVMDLLDMDTAIESKSKRKLKS